LNEFLRNTEVSRVDKPNEFFQFTENFHGNAPLEVLNVQRTFENSFSDEALDVPVSRSEVKYVKVSY